MTDKNNMAEISLLIGMMRGILMTVEVTLDQKKLLERIDNTIDRLFYRGSIDDFISPQEGD